jgi:hypothetical protein
MFQKKDHMRESVGVMFTMNGMLVFLMVFTVTALAKLVDKTSTDCSGSCLLQGII